MYRLAALIRALLDLKRVRRFVRFRDVAGSELQPGCVVLRFDVERDIAHHLRIASDLAKHGIVASMYFHTRRDCFDPDALRAIQDVGHEVGYHHECLDRCAGDRSAARELFLHEVALFRRHGLRLSTCCSHGEPGLHKAGYRSNWELFHAFPELLDEAALDGEVYLWRYGRDLSYATDTFVGYRRFFTTIDRAAASGAPLMVLVHAHRWRDRRTATVAEVVRDLRQHATNRVLRRRAYDTVVSDG